MYQPSEDLAIFEQEKHSLKKHFASHSRFVLGLKLSRGHLIGEKIKDKHFVESQLENIQLMDVEFLGCNFNEVKILSSELRHVTFKNCSFRGFSLLESELGRIEFVDCYIEDSDIDLKSPELLQNNVIVRSREKAPQELLPQKAPAPQAVAAPVQPKQESGGRFGALEK